MLVLTKVGLEPARVHNQIAGRLQTSKQLPSQVVDRVGAEIETSIRGVRGYRARILRNLERQLSKVANPKEDANAQRRQTMHNNYIYKVDAGIMRQLVLWVIIEKPFYPLIIFTYPPKAFTTSVSFLIWTVMLNVLCVDLHF